MLNAVYTLLLPNLIFELLRFSFFLGITEAHNWTVFEQHYSTPSWNWSLWLWELAHGNASFPIVILDVVFYDICVIFTPSQNWLLLLSELAYALDNALLPIVIFVCNSCICVLFVCYLCNICMLYLHLCTICMILV